MAGCCHSNHYIAFLIIFLSGLITLSSCSKEKSYDYQNVCVEGFVLDVTSEEPLENAEINVYEWHYWNLFSYSYIMIQRSRSFICISELHFIIN